jgi:hypothetical protein
MTLVLDRFRTLLPSRAKTSPSGWISFNAPCCHHRGHSQDKRKRGGVRFDTGVIYNCFNCKFSASWQPGKPLSEKFKAFSKWLGASDDDVNTMMFEALKTESPEYKPRELQTTVNFQPKSLPEGALPIQDWIDVDFAGDENEQYLAEVVKYIVDRGHNPLSDMFYWSPVEGYKDRVIIPFRYKGKIVGNTARKVNKGRPKYLSDQHSHFVFNVDEQRENQRYIFVTEGPFDALAIGGVALLTNSIAEQQYRIIQGLGHEIIVIPDQDEAGLNLINKAIEFGWSVAFPNWDDDVKDVAEAVTRYGKLFVTVDAIKTAQAGSIKLSMAKKNFEAKLEKQNEKNNRVV